MTKAKRALGLCRKTIVFRLLAVLVGVLPFAIIEVVLTLAGGGAGTDLTDPFVGFAEIVPLFELSEDKTKYVVSPSRYRFFAPEEFSAQKKENTFRVFCLGGSTVQGRPYSIETSFTSWLGLTLRAAAPERNWEVINCGGISYASYRLVPILKECLNYQPDLIVIGTGHNEFLEDRSYSKIKQMPGCLESPLHWMSQRRTVVFASRLFDNGQDDKKPILPTDADPMLDYQNGIAAFHRDDEWTRGVQQHFRSNMLTMAQVVREARTPLLFLQLPSNLSGTDPFKSVPTPKLSSRTRREVKDLLGRAYALYSDDLPAAADLLKRACDLDSRSAKNWYEYGQVLERLGRFEEARDAYVTARDQDVCPLRMTTPLEQSLQAVARDQKVPLLNVHALLESNTDNGILGDFWLVDHVHPSISAHQQIGLAIASLMRDQNFVELNDDWRQVSQQAFQRHFDSLERTYFHRGNRMLEALENWTRGDADGPPVERRFPDRVRGSSLD